MFPYPKLKTLRLRRGTYMTRFTKNRKVIHPRVCTRINSVANDYAEFSAPVELPQIQRRLFSLRNTLSGVRCRNVRPPQTPPAHLTFFPMMVVS